MRRNKSDTQPTARYIKVPLPMFRLLIQDKQKIGDVIAYGVYLTAMGQKVSMENAALQLMYEIHRGGYNSRVGLPAWVTHNLEEIEKISGIDEIDAIQDFDGEGDSGMHSSFMPYDGNGVPVKDRILKYCETHGFFAQNIAEFHALRQVAALFNFEWINVDRMKGVHEKYKRFDNDVFAFANIDIMLKYKNDIGQKSEDDMACLLMYLAYKSIIGEKDLAKASTELVQARMVGAKGRDELDGILAKNNYAKTFFDRYSKREVFERIRGMVSKYKFIPRIQTIPGKPGLGTFVSCDHYISDKKFAEKISKMVEEERKRKNREYVAKHRAKYSLKNDTNKYLAQMFGDT